MKITTIDAIPIVPSPRQQYAGRRVELYSIACRLVFLSTPALSSPAMVTLVCGHRRARARTTKAPYIGRETS